MRVGLSWSRQHQQPVYWRYKYIQITDDNTPLTTNQCPILPSLVDIPPDTGDHSCVLDPDPDCNEPEG